MPSEPSQQTMLFNGEPKQAHSLPYDHIRSMEPLSRHADPLPSYKAADGLRRSGVGGRQRLAVYHALRANQGCTSAELARIMDVDRYQPSRRLPELVRAGWVCRGTRRRCSVTHVVCETWWIVRAWAEGRKSGSPVPSRTAQQAAPAPGAGEPEPVLSPEQRRELRRRLAAQGDSFAATFTAASPSASSAGGDEDELDEHF